MDETVVFALTAGSLAAVNPCGFALLPAYLSLFVLGADRTDRPSAVLAAGRAVAATGAMTLGFVGVFGVFGLALSPIASTVQRWLPAVTVVIGIALVALGLFLLAGRALSLHVPFLRLTDDPTRSPAAMMLYGVSYAIASLGCTIGPFLAVTASSFRGGDFSTGVLAYAAYGVGMGLVVGVLAIAAAVSSQAAAATMRSLIPVLTRLSGALLVAVGAYVSWYGVYELRVYGGGDADDPVVAAAGRLQGRLVAGLDALGQTAFLLSLGLLAVVVAAWLAARRKARP